MVRHLPGVGSRATSPLGLPNSRRDPELFRKPLQPLVESDAEAVERHRHEVVLTDGEDQVHHLPGIVGFCQGVPGFVADACVLVQLVDGLQQ